jgi:hypothetical protein
MANVGALPQSMIFGVIAGPSMSSAKGVILLVWVIINLFVVIGLTFSFVI